MTLRALALVFVAAALTACPSDKCKTDEDCPTKGNACCNGACIDVENDKNNCGECGVTCEFPNSTPACRVGRCQLSCKAGFGNCNAMRDDGCELDLTGTIDNCGICGRVCESRNNAPVCRAALCVTGTCSANFADCDMDSTTGCEIDTRIDSDHCGACGMKCMLPNATSHCDASTCEVTSCAASFGDCDLLAPNGCEASLPNDAMNCGACGKVCGPAQFCALSKCRANELILFGGRLSFMMSGATAELYRFSLDTNTFEVINAATPAGGGPSARSQHVAVYDQPRNRMIVWGGVDGVGTPSSTEVWQLDFAVVPPRWSTVTVQGAPPSSRFGSVSALDPVSNKVYLFGGTTELGEGLSDLFTFDLSTNTWARIHDSAAMNSPGNRINAMGAFDPTARVFMVFGGNNATFRTDYAELWQFDVATQQWKTPPITDLEGGPPPRARGAFISGSPVFMFSGIRSLLVPPASMQGDLRTVDVRATTPWVLLPGMLTTPDPRFNAGSTRRDGLIFVYAGGAVTGATSQEFGDLWRFDPGAVSWTRLHDGTGTVPNAKLAPSVVAR